MKKQLTESLPLVVVELGSNSVRAIAAKRIDKDTLSILGYEQSSKFPSVDRGMVINSTNTGFMISEVLKLLGNRIGVPNLPTAFTLVGGRTMQSVVVSSRRDLVRMREVTPSILAECEQECKQKIENAYPDAVVIGLIPASYVLDGNAQEEIPTSQQRARQLEVYYTAFVGKRELETKLTDSFDRGRRSIERSFVRPEALLSAFAAEDPSVLDKGCAVIDFGAQTTTLSIYRGNAYLFNHVFAQGGYHITRNIEQQGLNFANAEKIKCQIGVAAPQFVERNQMVHLRASSMEEELSFTLCDLAEVIQQKLDEILEPVFRQLEKFKPSVVFITGGGSLLKGIDQYIQSKVSVPVLYGSHACLLDHDTPDEFCSPQYSSLIGALILGADYRDAHPSEAVRKPGFIEQLIQKTGDLFMDENSYDKFDQTRK